jgi:hypothetical protein
MLKDYMNEAVRILQEFFEKKLKVTPRIIAGLHTFGARMYFNPHIHMLFTMGGMNSLKRSVIMVCMRVEARR